MTFNIMIVGQRGRLTHEACLFAATLRHNAPGWDGRLIVAAAGRSLVRRPAHTGRAAA